MRERLRALHYSYRTEQAYVHWIRFFVRWSGMRHPREMGRAEVERFLTHLATERHVSASTQNQALSALLFLYRRVLDSEIEWVEDVVRAKRPERVPVVLTHDEVAGVLARLRGRFWLMASLVYGTGLGVVGGSAVRSPMDALGVAAGAPSLSPDGAGGGPVAVASES